MNPARRFDRTSKEYIILSLSLMTALTLLPFVILRMLEEDWLVSGLDAVLMILALYVFFFVYTTRQTESPSLLLSLLFVFGEVMTVVLKGPTQLLWAFPCTMGIYYLIRTPLAITLNATAAALLYSLTYDKVSAFDSATFILTLTATNVFTVVFALRNKIQKRELEQLTLIDPATGAHNRRAFEKFMDQVNMLDVRERKNLSVLMLNIDLSEQGKRLDNLAAEETRARIVALTQSQLYAKEIVYRVSPDDFAIAPIHLDQNSVKELAAKLCKTIHTAEEHSFAKVTFGTAVLSAQESAETWIQRANTELLTPCTKTSETETATPEPTP